MVSMGPTGASPSLGSNDFDERWLRIALVIHETSTDALKPALDHAITTKHADLASKTFEEKLQTALLRDKLPINNSLLAYERLIVFPSSGCTGSFEDFDIVIVGRLIKFFVGNHLWARETSGLPPIANLGSFDLKKASRIALVEMLKNFRNWVFHYSGTPPLSEPEFLQHWDELLTILQGLGYNASGVNCYKDGPLDYCNKVVVETIQELLKELPKFKSELLSELEAVRDKQAEMVTKDEFKTACEGFQADIKETRKATMEEKLEIEEISKLREMIAKYDLNVDREILHPDRLELRDSAEGKEGATNGVAEHFTLQLPREAAELSISPVVLDWHSTERTLRNILAFHDKFARYPQIEEAKVKLREYLEKFENSLRAQGLCKRLAYVGSTYENLKIISAPLDFNVLCVCDGTGLKIAPIPSVSGYSFLQPSSADVEFAGLLDTQGRLCPSKVVSAFYGAVQKVVNAERLEKLLTLKKHGPAIVIKVKKEGDSKPWFTIDLVPTYEIVDEGSNRAQFVPKAIGNPGSQDQTSAWRQSFAEEEKSMLKSIDSDNECRKKTLRILKAMHVQDAALKTLRTYDLKTLLLHATKNGNLHWREKDLAYRVFGLLIDLQLAVQRRELPNFFIREINLLQRLEQVAATNVAYRIGELLRSEKKFMKLLDATVS